MYSRATSKQDNFSQRQQTKVSQRTLRQLALVNIHGDSYRQNKFGQVTDFMYRQNDRTFTFEFEASGEVCSVASSDGWTWTKGSNGWLVHNYFDCWNVSFTDCYGVYVSTEGIQATGNEPSMMGLPLRS